ncbi:MAG: dihydrofolate reductase [Gallionella sp.]
MTHLSIIVAMAMNRTIGKDNSLPWRCPDDLKRFKALTMGHHLIMGRKTFQSIGRALPGRTTVVVSRDHKLELEGCMVINSISEAVAACASDSQIFVVGGAEIYAQTLEIADTLYITEIQKDVAGDTLFPEFDLSAWDELSREFHHQVTPEPLDYHFVVYRRNKS